MTSEASMAEQGIGKEKTDAGNVKSSLNQLNDDSEGKRKFRSIGLYIAANAGFRKCIVRNRGDGQTAPITLEDLFQIPDELERQFREKRQPKMSCQMEDTLTSLNKVHLIKTTPTDGGDEEKNTDEVPNENRLLQRNPMLHRYRMNNERTTKMEGTSKSKFDKTRNETTTARSGDLVLPRISSVTENLLIRSKRLDRNIEKLKLQNGNRAQMLSRSASSAEVNLSLSSARKQEKLGKIPRTLSLNLPAKYNPP